MRRLLRYLGFLPLVLVAVRAFAQAEAQPGWDPVQIQDPLNDIIVGVVFGPVLGIVLGLVGMGRDRLHRMRAVPKIYSL